MSTALVYTRQSRHKDYERTVSPQVQEASCRALAPVHECDVVEVFTDLDKSGKSIAQRPEFRRFLARIEADPPEVVAAYDQSRTFRNTAEALDFYALMERLRQVQVVFVHRSFDRSAVGEFNYTALAAAHTMERRMIEGRWDALIDPATWAAVQALVNRRRTPELGGNKPLNERRAYVFGGLLRCVRCGRRMHCHAIKDRPYYQCRGNDRAEPCRRGVREDALTPWVEELFTALDRFRPADLLEQVREQHEAGGEPRHVAPGALAQLESTIARLGKRFEWGHIDEATYVAEHARLTAQREDLMRATQEPPAVRLPLGSLMDGWQTGTRRVRHDLVTAFFDELDVSDGAIVSVVPRSEYAAEVITLLELVARERSCSPGGIRANVQSRPPPVPPLRFV